MNQVADTTCDEPDIEGFESETLVLLMNKKISSVQFLWVNFIKLSFKYVRICIVTLLFIQFRFKKKKLII